MAINLKINAETLVIEFNELSEKVKAYSRCMSKNDIGYINYSYYGFLECVIAHDPRTWTVAGPDYNGTINDILKIGKINDVDITTTEELKTAIYNWKNNIN